MQMTERWVAVSALGAAMFAVGFSFTGVACNAREASIAEAARAVTSASAIPAPAASIGRVASVVNGAGAVVPAVPATSPATSPAGAVTSASGDLKLKRLVVAHQIEHREPLGGGEDFALSNAPVYAFVEFENSARSARTVQVWFENQETKATVGHVKLTVPGGQGRFRTWGNTRMIRDAGHWVAVVSTSDGVELGRAPFEVKG